MSLQNLLGISLDAVEPDKAQIRRLLASAERNLADARISALAAENQFDVAYKAILQLAMLALNANGYRTLTSRPGHHQTAIQALALTIGLRPDSVRLLDALRKQRNRSDYSGEPVSRAAVVECVRSADELLVTVKAWLADRRPDLL